MQVVKEGDKVLVHYVKVFQDGTTVSSRDKTGGVEVTVGIVHPKLPGLGLGLVGLYVGDTSTFIVPAAAAYGPRDPHRIYRLTRTRFADGKELAVGERVCLRDKRQRRRSVRILQVLRNSVVVDANHRWAGQSLELEVEVMAISAASVAGGGYGGPGGYTADLQGDAIEGG